MPNTFTIRDAIAVPMRDGTILSTDVWLPDGAGPWPVLLQRTPYRREDPLGAQYTSAVEFQSALRRGFAVAVQDTRGRYAAQGDFDPFHWEGRDGVDTIAWLRGQPFCDGRIAMFGASYVGATQVLAAAEHPEGLVAISPQLTTARHGETWMYRGGAVELGFLLLWIIAALGGPDLDRRLAAMDAQTAQRLWAFLAAWARDPDTVFARLPIVETDLLALAPYAAQWFDDTRAAAARDDRERLDAIASSDTAMLVSAGWNDIFVEGSLELFQTARGRHENAQDVKDRLIIGPWSHGNPSDWQGAFSHGPTASAMQLPQAQLDFFEAVMNGATPKQPMVRYFRTGSNTWHAAPDWPLPGTQSRALYLDGARLSDDAPSAFWSRSYVSDPRDPVPTVGGATFLPGLTLGRNSGPMDQSAVEARSDVLLFTSSPLATDMEVTGCVEVDLFVRSDAPSADWTARLCVCDTEGHSVGLVDGIERWVNPAPKDEDLQAVTIRLGHISHLFRAGTRVRLQIASSNFPRFDRNPQSGTPASRATASDFVPATQQVCGGPQTPCVLRLPVVASSYPELDSLHAGQ